MRLVYALIDRPAVNCNSSSQFQYRLLMYILFPFKSAPIFLVYNKFVIISISVNYRPCRVGLESIWYQLERRLTDLDRLSLAAIC